MSQDAEKWSFTSRPGFCFRSTTRSHSRTRWRGLLSTRNCAHAMQPRRVSASSRNSPRLSSDGKQSLSMNELSRTVRLENRDLSRVKYFSESHSTYPAKELLL